MLLTIAAVKSYAPYGTRSGVYWAANDLIDMFETFNESSHRILPLLLEVKSEQELSEAADTWQTILPVEYTDGVLIIIEGIWADAKELVNLREKIKSIYPCRPCIIAVRSHSQFAFLDIQATVKMMDYIKNNIPLIFNEFTTYYAFIDTLWDDDQHLIYYLPNPFKLDYDEAIDKHDIWKSRFRQKTYYDIGCFGELRPMKNHVTAALASVRFASWMAGSNYDKIVRFNVNTSFDTDPILQNIRGLFSRSTKGTPMLKEHLWQGGEDFNHLIQDMDIGLQASFSETFNITSARFIQNGIYAIGGLSIDWLTYNRFNSHDPVSIFNCLRDSFIDQNSFWGNRKFLKQVNALEKRVNKADRAWREFLSGSLALGI